MLCARYQVQNVSFLFLWVAYSVGFQLSIYSETSGSVRKAGSNFKEKFREHGGLDAVFDVTRQCHLNMKVRALHGLNLFIS